MVTKKGIFTCECQVVILWCFHLLLLFVLQFLHLHLIQYKLGSPGKVEFSINGNIFLGHFQAILTKT